MSPIRMMRRFWLEKFAYLTEMHRDPPRRDFGNRLWVEKQQVHSVCRPPCFVWAGNAQCRLVGRG